jgi:DNA-binding NarL/FixJ family response regulator
MIRYGSHHNIPRRLTPRQREVLGLVAEGRSNRAIARLLGVSEKAVVSHMSRIYDQLDLFDSIEDHRRVLAAVTWLTAQPTGERAIA